MSEIEDTNRVVRLSRCGGWLGDATRDSVLQAGRCGIGSSRGVGWINVVCYQTDCFLNRRWPSFIATDWL